MGDPITPEQRRAAEERLRARYADELVNGPHGPADRPRGWDTTFGVQVEDVALEGSYPATLLVVTLRSIEHPECRFAWHSPLWTPDTVTLDEPCYDELLWMYMIEWVHRDLPRNPDCRDGVTIKGGVMEPATTT